MSAWCHEHVAHQAGFRGTRRVFSSTEAMHKGCPQVSVQRSSPECHLRQASSQMKMLGGPSASGRSRRGSILSSASMLCDICETRDFLASSRRRASLACIDRLRAAFLRFVCRRSASVMSSNGKVSSGSSLASSHASADQNRLTSAPRAQSIFLQQTSTLSRLHD